MRIVPNQTRSMTGDTETELFPTWFSASSFTHRIAVDILQNGPISRVSLARRFGLTQGAVSRITSDLAHWGVIETAGLLPTSKEGQTKDPRTNQDKTEGDFSETGAARTRLRAGRPQQALVIRHDAKTFIGVNLHGATAMAVAVDLACQPVGMPHQKEIQHRGPGQVTEVLTGLVRDCMAEIRQAGLPDFGHAVTDQTGQNLRHLAGAPVLDFFLVGHPHRLACKVYGDGHGSRAMQIDADEGLGVMSDDQGLLGSACPESCSGGAGFTEIPFGLVLIRPRVFGLPLL